MIFKITARTCELLDPKIEKSPTNGDFENFDPQPQLDIKFKIFLKSFEKNDTFRT